jgi:hypothetical protein
MSDSIVRLKCLERRDARRFLRVQALEQNPHAFLATHTPMTNLRVRRGNITEPDQDGLFSALQDVPPDQSALFIVRGAKGSGKSHLIRWLHHRLDTDTSMKPVFLERSDSSLRGMLERLVQHFGDEIGTEGLETLRGASEQLTNRGLATRLLDNLALYLDPDASKHWVGGPEERELSQDLRLAELFRNGRIRDALTSKRKGRKGYAQRLLQKLSEGSSAHGEASDPAEEVRFELEDMNQIIQIPTGQLGELLDRAVNRLRGEQDLRPPVRTLIDKCVKPAVQGTLGLARDELPRLFRRFRERLHGRYRLLLLIEDVSVFQGVDDQLLEALIPDDFDQSVSGGAPRAPILSVVGVTDDYYERFVIPRGAFRDRITHEVQLTLRHEDGDANGRSFVDDAVGFVARYLNLLRHAPESTTLGAWASTKEGPPPSACEECEERSSCHRTFGAFEPKSGAPPFGLYPFTEQAISNIVPALWDPSAGREPTPRKVLHFLREAVTALASIDHDGFPTQSITSESLVDPNGAMPLSAGVRRQVAALTHGDSIETLLRWWGDGRGDLRETEHGRLAGGVPEQLYEVFGLPFPSDLFGGTPPEPPDNGHKKPDTENKTEEGRDTTSERGEEPPSPLLALERDLEAWGDGDDSASLPSHAALAKAMLDAAYEGVVWEHQGIPHWFGAQLTHNMPQLIAFEGIPRGARSGKPAFVVQKMSWLDLLALMQVKHGGTVDAPTRHAATGIAASARAALLNYVRDSMPRLTDGTLWSPATSALRLLYLELLTGNPGLASAYRGEWHDLLPELLREHPNRDASIEARSPEWKSFRGLFRARMGNDLDRRSQLVDIARKWLGLTQGGASSSACFDASAAIDALIPVIKVPEWDPPSPKIPAHAPNLLGELADFERDALGQFRRAIEYERTLAQEVAEGLRTNLGDDELLDVIQQIERLDKAIGAVESTSCHQARRNCAQALERLPHGQSREKELGDGWGQRVTSDLEHVAGSSSAEEFMHAADGAPWMPAKAVLEVLKFAKQLHSQASNSASQAEKGLPSASMSLADAVDDTREALRALAEAANGGEGE